MKPHTKSIQKIQENKQNIITDRLNKLSLTKLAKKYKTSPIKIKELLLSENLYEPLTTRKNTFDCNYFNGNDIHKFWFIGLLAADGSINPRKHSLCINQSGENGLKIINHICKIANYTLTPSQYLPNVGMNSKMSYGLNFASQKMCDSLIKYNIIPNKTKTYDLPKDLSENEFRDFLRGYIDGDGCIGINHNTQGIEYLAASFVGSKKFIYSVSDKMNFKTKIMKLKGVYEMRINGQEAILFCNWLYKNEKIFKSHKYDKYNKFIFEYTPDWSDYNYKKRLFFENFIHKNNFMNDCETIGVSFQTLYKWKKRYKVKPIFKQIGNLLCEIKYPILK